MFLGFAYQCEIHVFLYFLRYYRHKMLSKLLYIPADHSDRHLSSTNDN